MNYQLNLSLFSNSIIYNIYIIIYILYIKRKTRSFYSEIYGIQREKKTICKITLFFMVALTAWIWGF